MQCMVLSILEVQYLTWTNVCTVGHLHDLMWTDANVGGTIRLGAWGFFQLSPLPATFLQSAPVQRLTVYRSNAHTILPHNPPLLRSWLYCWQTCVTISELMLSPQIKVVLYTYMSNKPRLLCRHIVGIVPKPANYSSSLWRSYYFQTSSCL